MGKSRRKHSREFKVEAVRQVVEQGRSISEVAVGLGIHPSLLLRWKHQLVAEGAVAFRGNGVVSLRTKSCGSCVGGSRSPSRSATS